MKTLKSMLKFVKEQKQILKFDPTPTNEKLLDFAINVIKREELLSQPPNIGMFVPAVCEGGVWRVLELPHPSDYNMKSDDAYDLFNTDIQQYQQAKSKVIFKGFTLVGDGFEGSKTVFEIENDLYFIEFIGDEITLTINSIDQDIDIHTLEDLVEFNLEMV